MHTRADIYVSGQAIWVQPYNEHLKEQLISVQNEIKSYTDQHPSMLFDDMPISDKARFWKMKGDILWHPLMPISFYESDEFELEYLQETENIFWADVAKYSEIAENYYLTARNYMGSGPTSLKKSIWTNKIGNSRYNALILANFDPVRANAIMELRIDQIAQAYVSKMCYEYIDPQTQKKR